MLGVRIDMIQHWANLCKVYIFSSFYKDWRKGGYGGGGYEPYIDPMISTSPTVQAFRLVIHYCPNKMR
jgi:hypothetical protein